MTIDGLRSAHRQNGPDERPDSGLVQLHDVWRSLGRGRHQRTVLAGVSLKVPGGGLVGIAGENGAGKTTLLRIATAILLPDRGTVAIDGISSTASWREYHRRVGFLSAGDRGLYARFSVRGHLRYAARVALMDSAQVGTAVDAMLARFDLADLADRRADRLSQGQRQRLRLALAFVHRPRVVMLDEPRNSLDGAGIDMLIAAVADVCERDGAVLWICPAKESQPVAFDALYTLSDGQLVQSS